MHLKGKVIVLISSESWGDIYISKHNYAIALARRGNTVYFLNPIRSNLPRGAILIEPSGVHPDLKIISYKPYFPVVLKFHAPRLFTYLMQQQIRRIVKRIGGNPDVVWDFNCSFLYHNLYHFGASATIFHPVDLICREASNKPCDVVFSVSDEILKKYSRPGVPKYLVSHGLAEPFVKLASAPPVQPMPSGRPVRVGYVGNIMMEALDREVMKEVIAMNPSVEFHFVGPYTYQKNNIADERYGDSEYGRFLSFMQQQPNVFLHGPMKQQEVAAFIDRFDMFLLCYRPTNSYLSDNSHKVLEYLSTGKTVVSSYLSFYTNRNLLEMAAEAHNEQLPLMVKMVAGNLHIFNSIEIQRIRKAWALEHGYEQQIKKIERYLNEACNPQKRAVSRHN